MPVVEYDMSSSISPLALRSLCPGLASWVLWTLALRSSALRSFGCLDACGVDSTPVWLPGPAAAWWKRPPSIDREFVECFLAGSGLVAARPPSIDSEFVECFLAGSDLVDTRPPSIDKEFVECFLASSGLVDARQRPWTRMRQ